MITDLDALYFEPCRDFVAPFSCYSEGVTGPWCDPCAERRTSAEGWHLTRDDLGAALTAVEHAILRAGFVRSSTSARREAERLVLAAHYPDQRWDLDDDHLTSDQHRMFARLHERTTEGSGQ